MPNVIDASGKVVREMESPAVLNAEFGDKLTVVYRAVHREFANSRAGTASTLKRDEVRGGGRKPWRQKGTGRARQGSIRSPQWRKGGVVFGPHPRSYVIDMNKRQRRIALAQGIAQRCSENGISIIDVTGFAPVKTKEIVALLFGQGV